MHKHSPVPWSVKRPSRCVVDAESCLVAECRQRDGDEANINLISAAPDLLEACIAAIRTLHPGAVGLLAVHHGSDAREKAIDTVGKLREAITKAEGKECFFDTSMKTVGMENLKFAPSTPDEEEHVSDTELLKCVLGHMYITREKDLAWSYNGTVDGMRDAGEDRKVVETLIERRKELWID